MKPVSLMIQLPKQLRKRVRVASAEREETIQQFVIDALERALGSTEASNATQ